LGHKLLKPQWKMKWLKTHKYLIRKILSLRIAYEMHEWDVESLIYW
jgi:hypothetical protein